MALSHPLGDCPCWGGPQADDQEKEQGVEEQEDQGEQEEGQEEEEAVEGEGAGQQQEQAQGERQGEPQQGVTPAAPARGGTGAASRTGSSGGGTGGGKFVVLSEEERLPWIEVVEVGTGGAHCFVRPLPPPLLRLRSEATGEPGLPLAPEPS